MVIYKPYHNHFPSVFLTEDLGNRNKHEVKQVSTVCSEMQISFRVVRAIDYVM